MVTTSQSQLPEAGPPAGGRGAPNSGVGVPSPSSAAPAPGAPWPGARSPGARRNAPGRATAPETRTLRLTGRGAVVVIFVLSLLGAFVAEEFHWNAADGVGYVAACAIAARYLKPGYLLVAVVTPPLIFVIAVTLVKAATATGAVLTATTAGTLLTLGTSAPWLFAGTLLALAVTMARGLVRDIRELRANLRGDRGLR
jgi:hypothetical protein